MCILDVYFPLVWKKSSYGSEYAQNLEINLKNYGFACRV